MKGWIFLAMAIACEISGTTCMKLSHGFTRPWPSVLMFVFYGGTLACMNVAISSLEMGLVYAVWSGAGTAIVAAIGILFFQESLTATKIFCVVLIIVGVVGLNLSSQTPAKEPGRLNQGEA